MVLAMPTLCAMMLCGGPGARTACAPRWVSRDITKSPIAARRGATAGLLLQDGPHTSSWRKGLASLARASSDLKMVGSLSGMLTKVLDQPYLPEESNMPPFIMDKNFSDIVQGHQTPGFCERVPFDVSRGADPVGVHLGAHLDRRLVLEPGALHPGVRHNMSMPLKLKDSLSVEDLKTERFLKTGSFDSPRLGDPVASTCLA